MPNTTLRSRHPNLILRCMRAMRMMLIEPTWWRIRYINLYCALRIMGPDAVPAMGARGACRSMRRRSVAFVMQNIIHDVQHPEMDDGHATCSARLMNQINLLEVQLRAAAGQVLIE
jgi:hypothetical protein